VTAASSSYFTGGLVHDLRDAVRALRASPLVSAIAILSLAFGIGANAAIFSITDSLVLRQLPVREPDRLALVATKDETTVWSNAVWEQVRDRPALFDGALAYSGSRFNVAEGTETEMIDGLWVSGSFFEMLGVPAVLGRTIFKNDDQPGGGASGPVVVISNTYWHTRYGGSRDVIGRTIKLESASYTIVGVTPSGFFGPVVGEGFDVAIPLGTEAMVRPTSSLLARPTGWLSIMVRLAPGQSLHAATTALRTMQPRIREATAPAGVPPAVAAKHLEDPFVLVAAAGGSSFLRDRYARPLITIMVVVGLVLLIACGNIANLMLARATARRHELTVRTALGATRLHLFRKLLLESAVLSAIGGALGIAIALVGSRVLVHQLSTDITRVVLDVTMSWRLIGFTSAIAIGTALLFGTAPAIRATRVEAVEVLKERGRGATGGRTGGGGLVIAQVALSLVLVVAAGLFTRTFRELAHLDLGFDRERVLLATVRAQRAGVPPTARAALYDRVRQSVLTVPGVTNAAASRITPISGSSWSTTAEVVDGRELAEQDRGISMNLITPGWFATYGTRFLGGRDFDSRDGPQSPRVAIVNQTFVKQFLGSASPLGRVITLPRRADGTIPTLEIIGLVSDAVYRSLRDPVPATVYVPMPQQPGLEATTQLAIRSRTRPEALTRNIAAAIAEVDPKLTVTFRSLASQVESSLVPERILAMLSGFFGSLALLLAGLGLYGVTLYAVNRRRAEMGIRLALGVLPTQAMGLVLRRVGAQVGAGIAIGMVLSWWTTRFIGGLLYGLTPKDPATLVIATAILATVGALAGWIPARRVASIDPAIVLRGD
jgi:putative ABC transport system permease protein